MPPNSQPVSESVPPVQYLPPRKSHKLVISVVILLILAAIGAAAYAYVENIGPFARAPYQEDNLVSGLLAKAAEINSSNYTFSAALFATPRDADAVPFVPKPTDQALKEKYYRDYQRGEDVSGILSTLSYGFEQTGFPSSLTEAMGKAGYYAARNVSKNDPLTKAEYSYKTTENGTNFALTVTFETPNAVSTVTSYNKYAEKPTAVNGKTVTFTKDSYSYFYLPIEPPKTFLEELGEYTAYLPPEINVKGSVNATAQKNDQGVPAEWKFMLDGSGDFGDLTYKVNVEALKKDLDYYVRINNIPSFFSSFLPPKGQWVKFSPTASSTEESDPFNYSLFSSENIAEYEKDYKENKEVTVDFMKKVAAFADEEKLFAFKNAPEKEKVDGRSLYRYDLKVRKEAVLPFYKKVLAESEKNSKIADEFPFVDEGYVNYLESEAFSETFDYYEKNINVTLWVDQKGFPAIAKYSIRIVPPESSTALKGKQIMLDFGMTFDDINEPVVITAPEGAKTYEELMEGTNNPLSSARLKAESAALKANISSIRPSAEIAYDRDGGYGTKVFPLGACKQTTGTLFGDKYIYASLSSATKSDPSKATCVSGYGSDGKLSVYAISAPLPDKEGYSYCIDSTGSAVEILGSITKSSCR